MLGLLAICLCCRLCLVALWITDGLADGISNQVVKGERGQDVWLPCDVDSEHDDSPAKVLWYAPAKHPVAKNTENKHNNNNNQNDNNNTALWASLDATPFYMVEDTQRRGIWNGQHAIGISWAGRASFSVARSPAALRITQVELQDAGTYLCTVASHRGALRNSTVSLVVGVSPGVPTILTSDGTAVEGRIGPFLVGDDLHLVCVVDKGLPIPTITWRRDGVEVLREVVPGATDLDGVVRSTIAIDSLTRDDLLMELSCETSNTIGGPFEAAVTVDLTLEPLSVKIQNPQRSFEVDVSAEFRCLVVGSRPLPQVSWWLDEQRLEPFFTDEKANVTAIVLLLVLTAESDKATLTCRARNPRLDGQLWEDSIILNVLHAPRATLRLGQGLRQERIHEGQDVYLECGVRANPWVNDVSWTLDGEPLEGNGTTHQGLLVHEQYLVLRNVTAKFSGTYCCHVRNTRGAALSNLLQLRVQYAPSCKKGMQEVFRYSTSREELSIPCEMDADPEDLTFRWVMKNNSEVRDLVSFSSNGTRSLARYKPAVATEFVSLLCWANNSVGPQKTPCTYFVEPHGAPKALSGCAVVNQAMTWFFVRCSLDEDRPADQEWYLLEVYHADSGTLLGNVTAKGRPVFHVDDIPPATECLALAFAVNDHGGRSEPTKVVVQAIPPPSKLLTGGSASFLSESSPFLAGTILLSLAWSSCLVRASWTTTQFDGCTLGVR